MSDLEGLLIRHEGLKLRAYFDTQGKITIGVGRNLESTGISAQEALMLLSNDCARAERVAQTFAWYPALARQRQLAVLSMLFNLGLDGFIEFRRLIQALEAGDYEKAAQEMLASRWSGQVGKRAVELADMMRVG